MKLPNPLEIASDLSTLRRAGALRRLGLPAGSAFLKQVAREGVKSHLIYTIHGIRDAGKPAFVFEERVTTWGEAYERVRRLANHLLERGVRPSDTVAIMLPNRPEFVESQVAALRIGATTAFMNPRAPEADVLPLLERTDAKLLITHREDLHPEAEVLRIGDPYEEALRSASEAEPRMPKDAHGKVVIFTSGTTGRPKGAIRSLDQGASLSTFAGFLRTIPFHRDDVHMVVCPLYHSSGSGFATVAQVLGNPLVLVEKFSPEAFCEHVQRWEVSTTAVVPTMLHKLCEWPGAADYDLSTLRVVVCTGSPLREELRERARALFGNVLYDLYGSTEMAWVSVAGPDDQRRKPGSVGKPVPGVTVRILDPDGRPVPRGQLGEIWAGSNLLMEEYVGDPELTGERMRDGLVSVKDVGYLDEDGYLYVVDRADDMIISGGVNVYPAETEVALGQHPQVSQVSVVGVPDPEWGQRLVAAVVPDGEVSASELVEYGKQHLSYAAVPKEIRFFDDLPRNDIGKVDKRAIVEGWES